MLTRAGGTGRTLAQVDASASEETGDGPTGRPRRQPSLRSIEERNALVERNRWLVIWVAHKMERNARGQPSSDDDIQAGMLGLIRAAELWDPARGTFSTYAVPVIRRAIYRHQETRSGAIALPSNWTRLPEGDYRRERAERARGASALGDTPLVDEGADPAAGLDQISDREMLREALAVLPVRHREILLGYYVLGKTLGEIASGLEVSRERVRQLRDEAVHNLRFLLSDREWTRPGALPPVLPCPDAPHRLPDHLQGEEDRT